MERLSLRISLIFHILSLMALPVFLSPRRKSHFFVPNERSASTDFDLIGMHRVTGVSDSLLFSKNKYRVMRYNTPAHDDPVCKVT